MSIRPALQRGITLIEQIMFIVIVSVGVIGLVSVMNPAIRASADPLLTKQLVAITESLLNEVLHQPFTWCDPDDPAAPTALSYAACATPQNAFGPTPAGETRYAVGAGTAFDNVADYGGFSMANVDDPSASNAMAGYTGAGRQRRSAQCHRDGHARRRFLLAHRLSFPLCAAYLIFGHFCGSTVDSRWSR